VPAANILEYADKYEIILAIPGFKKEDMKIRVEKNSLVIEGEKSTQSEVKFKYREFNFDKIKRTFNLGDVADLNKISAKFNEGLLHISVMKSEIAQPKTIEIL
jgi:HSP20 family protein